MFIFHFVNIDTINCVNWYDYSWVQEQPKRVLTPLQLGADIDTNQWPISSLHGKFPWNLWLIGNPAFFRLFMYFDRFEDGQRTRKECDGQQHAPDTQKSDSGGIETVSREIHAR